MKFSFPKNLNYPYCFALISMMSFLQLRAEETIPSEVNNEITPPGVETSLTAPVPNEFKHLLIENPYVDFTVLISEDGKLKDSLPIASNHYGLIKAAQKIIDQTKFTPATLNGENVPIRYQIRVSFKDYDQEIWQQTGQLPMGSSVIDGTGRRMYDRSKDDFIYGQSNPNELDNPLQIAEGALVVMEDEQGNAPQGSCTVEFYINSEGVVKLPRVLKSDNDAISLSALSSLEKLRFNKPMQNGGPTFVKVRQRFDYGDYQE